MSRNEFFPYLPTCWCSLSQEGSITDPKGLRDYLSRQASFFLSASLTKQKQNLFLVFPCLRLINVPCVSFSTYLHLK